MPVRGLVSPERMKLPGIALAVAASWSCALPAVRADATSPVDYTRRNEALAPAASLAPEIRSPATNRIATSRPLDFTVTAPESSPLGDRRAPVEIAETHPKTIVAPAVRAPEAAVRPSTSTRNAFDRRRAAISTAGDAVHPPLVAKYQSGLAAGGGIQVGHLPALAPGASATINRFVFRHNRPVPDPAAAPAAGAGQ